MVSLFILFFCNGCCLVYIYRASATLQPRLSKNAQNYINDF